MARVFDPLEPAQYEESFALGKTKIMMNAEIREVLERSKAKASAIYDEKSAFLKRVYALTMAQ